MDSRAGERHLSFLSWRFAGVRFSILGELTRGNTRELNRKLTESDQNPETLPS